MKQVLTAAGFLIREDRVLLKYHEKVDLWLPFKTHVREGETPNEAIKRKFKDETGLEIEILNKEEITTSGKIDRELAVPFYANVHEAGDHNHICFYYVCKVEDAKEFKGRSKWFSKEDLEQEHVPDDVKNIALKAFKQQEQ